MTFQPGDSVRINCAASKYYGVIGLIFGIQESSGYAIVDMPKGTELRIEGIQANAMLVEMEAAEKTRKKPRRPEEWPKGDPQWFPIEWLVTVNAE